MSAEIILELPWPPSINHYWRHTKNGHYISAEGKGYRNFVYHACNAHRNKYPSDKRLRVSIEAYPPDRRKRDLDNILKSLLDSLQYACVYEDDSQIDFLSIRRNVLLQNKIIVGISSSERDEVITKI
jgi:crossover junction endodeoxyribonuclease RusA